MEPTTLAIDIACLTADQIAAAAPTRSIADRIGAVHVAALQHLETAPSASLDDLCRATGRPPSFLIPRLEEIGEVARAERPPSPRSFLYYTGMRWTAATEHADALLSGLDPIEASVFRLTLDAGYYTPGRLFGGGMVSGKTTSDAMQTIRQEIASHMAEQRGRAPALALLRVTEQELREQHKTRRLEDRLSAAQRDVILTLLRHPWLSTNEIAAMLARTPDSVRGAIHQIRAINEGEHPAAKGSFVLRTGLRWAEANADHDSYRLLLGPGELQIFEFLLKRVAATTHEIAEHYRGSSHLNNHQRVMMLMRQRIAGDVPRCSARKSLGERLGVPITHEVEQFLRNRFRRPSPHAILTAALELSFPTTAEIAEAANVKPSSVHDWYVRCRRHLADVPPDAFTPTISLTPPDSQPQAN
ncbi:MAG: hypothetical protein AAF589_04725 [Planctomycetota bacterium]